MFEEMIKRLEGWRNRYGLTSLCVEFKFLKYKDEIVFKCKKDEQDFQFIIPTSVIDSACNVNDMIEMEVKSHLSRL